MISAAELSPAWPSPGEHRVLLGGLVVATGVVGAAAAVSGAFGIGAAVAFAGALLVLRRPALGGYLLVAVVPVTSGFRSGMPVPQVRISEALIAGVAVPALIVARSRAGRWSAFDALALTWAASWTVFGLLDAARLHVALPVRSLEQLIGPFQFILLYRGVAICLPQRRQRRIALAVLMWASVPVALLAMAQQLRLPQVTRFVTTLTGGDVFNTYSYHYLARATGPFNHWTPLAGYLLVVMLCGTAMLLSGERPMAPRILQAILVLDAAAMVLSAELSTMVGYLIGAVALGIHYRRGRDIARWLVVATLVVAAAFGSYFVHRLHTQFGTTVGSGRSPWVPQTIAYRLSIWRTQYFPAVAAQPLAGWGTSLPKSISWPFSESQYVSLLMEGGVPVLLAYLAMMGALFALCADVVRRAAHSAGFDGERWRLDTAVADSLRVLVVMVALICVVFPYFTAGGLPEPFCVLVGLVVSARSDIVVQRDAAVAARLRPDPRGGERRSGRDARGGARLFLLEGRGPHRAS